MLAPDGRFCVCVTHPLSDAGGFTAREADAPFVIEGSYLGRRQIEETFERDRLTMTFHSWAYSLEEYGRAFETAGMLIELIREPAPAPEFAKVDPAKRRWDRIPNFSSCGPPSPSPRTGADAPRALRLRIDWNFTNVIVCPYLGCYRLVPAHMLWFDRGSDRWRAGVGLVFGCGSGHDLACLPPSPWQIWAVTEVERGGIRTKHGPTCGSEQELARPLGDHAPTRRAVHGAPKPNACPGPPAPAAGAGAAR